MSQVDYVHFFSNIVWSSIFLWIIYFLICVYYVQVFYKVLRLRFMLFNFLYFYLKTNSLVSLYWINNLVFNVKFSKKQMHNFFSNQGKSLTNFLKVYICI